ncbi:hypothetical protein [Rubrivivax gelatinosus]|uniref:hypothetical protein n=1 Tax=Rubrivivax gelatinosus TaxID=28068 RepID=UPI0005C1DBBE|nr:hypothetical protein [Rubrivivax gelatinosus]MBG6083101.1 hypothetical protein [Rubrivivax gelatinosus]
MNAKSHFILNADGSRTVIFGPSGEPKSLASHLTPDEAAALMAWTEQQPRNLGAAIDMMGWPGWEAVMARQFKDRFGVDLPKTTA